MTMSINANNALVNSNTDPLVREAASKRNDLKDGGADVEA
jgi:hypothetical protein